MSTSSRREQQSAYAIGVKKQTRLNYTRYRQWIDVVLWCLIVVSKIRRVRSPEIESDDRFHNVEFTNIMCYF